MFVILINFKVKLRRIYILMIFSFRLQLRRLSSCKSRDRAYNFCENLTNTEDFLDVNTKGVTLLELVK